MSSPNAPVLLAYDGSESSATAIAVAGRLLRGRQAIVCHAGTDGSRSGEADETAAEGVEIAREAGFDAWPLAVREGRRTWRALLEAAEAHRAPLVVVGAHGRSGPRRALLGSVSTGVVHHSGRPVLVVPGASAREDTGGPLLLCYDGSEPSRRAIAAAVELLSPGPALVLHFWGSWVAEAPALAALSRAVEGMAAELDELAGEQSARTTDEGVRLAGQAGFEATAVSKRAVGPGWMTVRDTADEHACAAVVIGSRGLTGVSAALGGVSNGVVHNCRRPVVVVPSTVKA